MNMAPFPSMGGNKSYSSETETSIIMMRGLNSGGGGPNLHHNISPSHPQPSSTIRSPTPTAIQFKFNATNQTLASDFDRLLENKNYYRDPLDDNKSILSRNLYGRGTTKSRIRTRPKSLGVQSLTTMIMTRASLHRIVVMPQVTSFANLNAAFLTC